MNDQVMGGIAGGLASRLLRKGLRMQFAALVGVSSVAAGGHANGDSSGSGMAMDPSPCPQIVEVLCEAPPSRDGASGPGLSCPCGPGVWTRLDPTIRVDPEQPAEQLIRIGRFEIVKLTAASGEKASATLSAAGRSNCFIGCDTSSMSETARASFSSISREVWQGAGPACARIVTLSANGVATQGVAVSTTADRGCSASASSSLSGMCASLGDASAELSNGITAKAQFNSASSKVTVSGNIGASVSIESPSIQGSYSSQDQWEAEGIGSASGTASFTVKPYRDYCALTNKPVVRRAAGSVALSAGAAVASGGASSFATSGEIRMSID